MASRKPARLLLVGLAAGIENAGDLRPARSRQVRSIDDGALDILDAVHPDRRRGGGGDLCGGSMRAAGGIGPGHEMIAAETRLAHHVLESDVGGARHRRHQRAPRWRCRDGATPRRNTPRLARSIISVWSRSSSTAKRAGTLASNGNCCSSRVHIAWMVCTFRPPGVSSAQANSLRADFAKRLGRD